MVRRELVSDNKLLEGEVVAVRCAHDDTVVYPLADVQLELEGDKVQVVAAVEEHLPVYWELMFQSWGRREAITQKS